MPKIQTVVTLQAKRDEILASLALYEKQVAQARSDLSHIDAIIRVFEASGDPKDMSRYVNLHRLFKRFEKTKLALEALEKHAELSTREIAAYSMKAKGLDTGDRVLLMAVTFRLISTMRKLAAQNRVVMAGKRGRMCVWRLA